MTIDFDLLPCGCLITSPDREILSVNQYFCEALGWQPEALTGQNMTKLLNKATQLFCESYVIPTVFGEGQCCEVLVSLTGPSGEAFPTVANVCRMPDGNIAWVFLEAEKRNRLFEELERARVAIQEQREKLELLSRTDELTGLANRRELECSARRIFLDADRTAASVAVLMLDIDCFKSVNDTYGHDIGDQVICALAGVLKLTCRKNDVVSRLGGDEFVCVLNRTDSFEANALCERLHEAIARTMVDGCQFTVSIGLAVKPHAAQMDFPDVLKLADQCLYIAKENGRNTSHMMTANAA